MELLPRTLISSSTKAFCSVARAGIAVGILHSPVSADPSDEIRYLMAEPASMLDIGILRMELELSKAHNIEGYDDVPSVSYDFSLNQMQIRYFKTLRIRSADDWRRPCLSALKDALGIVDTLFDSASDIFEHRGYTVSNAISRGELLDAMRTITQVELRLRGTNEQFYRRSCMALSRDYVNFEVNNARYEISERAN